MKNLIILLGFILGFSACEEQPVVIPTFDADNTGRVVLIEEITGVQCPNCPAGAATIKNLLNTFPDRVVAISYHSSFLAAPLEASNYDFRTQQADDIEEYIGEAIGKPSAIINRVKEENENFEWIATVDSWAGYTQNQLGIPPDIELDVELNFNADTRDLTVNVTATPIVDIEGEVKINIALTESHIIDPQLDQNTVIADYEHNHLFHTFIQNNIPNGDVLGNNLSANVPVEATYSYTIPDEDGIYVADNMEVVIFVAKDQGEGDLVLQAAMEHVIQ